MLYSTITFFANPRVRLPDDNIYWMYLVHKAVFMLIGVVAAGFLMLDAKNDKDKW